MTVQEGRITSVSVDDGICEVNVQLSRSGIEKRDVQIKKAHPGVTVVPDEGDIVLVDELKGGGYVVTGFMNRMAENHPVHDSPDEFSFMLDDQTEFSYIGNGDGTYDVVVSCGGELKLGSNSASSQVARKGDSVEVDDGTNTYTGTITSGSSVTKSE